MDLLIKEFILAHGVDKKYWLAYSGGLDSHVLLHLFAKARSLYPIDLKAIYVNHGVSSHALAWEKHCRKKCDELNVTLIQKKLTISSNTNLEDQLRQSRYRLFEELLEPNDILLTAHHQNDQAETVLLQLCRGAGPQGLAAMPRIKRLGQGFHARPLLDLTREELQSYAEHHELHWVEDESNTNTQFTRNFLRHEIIPILTKRWPGITKTLARTAEHCALAQQWIDQTAEHCLARVKGTLPNTLSVKKLLQLNSIEQRHTLRAWIEQTHFSLPSAVKMQQILQNILLAGEDKMPHVHWGNVEIRRYRDNLFLSERLGEHDAKQIIPWKLSEPLTLPHIGTLQTLPSKGEGLRADIENVTVQFRQGGETLRLPGRKHHHELKKVFQMWGVLPWLRDRIPLIYVDGVLAVIPGWWIAEEFLALDGEPGSQIVLDV